jgi:hypothetical protein
MFNWFIPKKKVTEQEAIGKTIICEDGSSHRVVEIVWSQQYPWMAIINEQDPDSKSGYFVNVYCLMKQLAGHKPASVAEKEAFKKHVQNMSYREVNVDKRAIDSWKPNKSGIYLPN